MLNITELVIYFTIMTWYHMYKSFYVFLCLKCSPIVQLLMCSWINYLVDSKIIASYLCN